jgi:conjugal transfer ATP-binding protein TraC
MNKKPLQKVTEQKNLRNSPFSGGLSQVMQNSSSTTEKKLSLKAKILQFVHSTLLQDSEKPLGSGSLQNINERLGLYSLSEYLPYETYDPSTELYHCKEAKGIVLEASPMVGASDNHGEVFYSLLQRLLPEGTILHCVLYASPKIAHEFDGFVKERQNHHPLTQRLAEQRAAFYKQGIHYSLIPGQQAVLRDYRLLISLVFDNQLGFTEPKILSLKNALIGALKGVGMSPQVLEPESFLQWVDNLLRPNDSGYEQEFHYSELDTLACQLSQPQYARTVTPTKIFVNKGDTQHWQIRNFRVSHFKEQSPHLSEMSDCIGNLFDASAQIGCPFSLSFIIQIAHQNKEQDVARARAFRARQRAEKIARFSPQAVEEAGIARGIINAIENAERLVNVSFQVSLYCQNDTADEQEAALFNIFQASSTKWQLTKNNLLQMAMLLAHLPLAQSQSLMKDLKSLGVLTKVWAKNAANMLPIVAEMKGMRSPRLMIAGRRGQILFWDNFANNRGNYNVCVSGISGSGKSVTVQELVSSLVGTGGRVFIIDVGRSYKKVCHVYGGEFIEFNKEIPLCLNPFSAVNEVEEFLDFMTPFVCSMIHPSGDASAIEVAYVAKAVKSVWETKKHQGALTDIADWLLAQEDPRAKDLGVVLYPYTREGQYKDYFNGEANIDFDNPMVIFELEEISGNKRFQSILFMLLMYHVTEKMYLGGRAQQIALIIDEAWDMLKGGQGGAIIENIARRARKYKGCLITITQSIADYFASSAALAAYTNSYWKLIHMQNKADVNRLVEEKKLILDPFQKRLLCSVTTEHGAYSELMILGDGQECAVGRLFLDPYSRILYSTQARDFADVNQLCQQGVPLADAIALVAKERFS